MGTLVTAGVPGAANAGARSWAVRGAKVYPSPEVRPIENGTVLIRGDRIAEVGENLPIPAGVPVYAPDGAVVTAGFWNTHVHFTEPKWAGGSRNPSSALNAGLADMLTSRGFTSVADLGSDPRVTFELRRRIDHGELRGPAIYAAGLALYPPKGIPFYVRDTIPWYLRWVLPQPSTPSAARRQVERNATHGADLVKLFTGSYVERGVVLPMPDPVAAAAVAEAHAHHQLVFAHPSNLAGTLVALRSGVDVLAHAPDAPDGIDDRLLARLVDRRTAMVPTLKMFGTTVTEAAEYLGPIHDIVRRFRGMGGELLFGTDVGYMTDYSTEGEFRALGTCGLTAPEVLRMLTTAPARRFGAGEKGVLAPGKLADLVVLAADPAEDIAAFARTVATVRNGTILWDRTSFPAPEQAG